MALILVFTNDRTGSDDAAHYDVRVLVNQRDIAGGRVEGHRRADGWVVLLERFLSGQRNGSPDDPHPYAEGTLLRAQHDLIVRDAVITHLQDQLTALQGERQQPHALELAAYVGFIKGVDISNTIEAARAVLVERALTAEAQAEALQGERDLALQRYDRARTQALFDAIAAEQRCTALRSQIGKYLDQHCMYSDTEGTSVLCECRLCVEARALLAVDPTPRGEGA